MTSGARALRVARRLYAVALYLWPRRVRDRHGDDMRATFDALGCDAAAHGALAVMRLAAKEIADVIRTARAARRVGHRSDPAAKGLGYESPEQRKHSMSSLWQDVRYACRMLVRQPGFAAVAVLTLALGVGANTAVFTVINGVLLRPLPYADPDRIVMLLNGRSGRLSSAFSPPNYLDVTAERSVFAGAAAFQPTTANLTGHGDPQRVEGADVTWTFFQVLGVTPRIGRAFAEADHASDAAVVVISDALWRRQFGARPDVVNATMPLDGKPFTIIGVAPPEVAIPRGAEYWRPLVFSPGDIAPQARGAQWVFVVGRLKPDVDLEAANSRIGIVADRLARDFPRTNQNRVMTAVRLHERLVSGVRPALLVLFGAVTLVLLIACVNVANLLLARGHGRTREVAMRAALGAGRARLIQQFLAESLVLGLAGALSGLVVAYWSTRALVALGPSSIPRLSDVGIDWRVMTFASAVSIATSVLFGLVPALASTTRLTARSITAGRGLVGVAGTRVRKTLVVCEMALAVMLLVGAGLLLRSYQRLNAVDPGFAADHVLTFSVALPEAKYPTHVAVRQFIAGLVDQLNTTPGVESAAAVFGLPLADDFSASSSFTKPGETDSANSPSLGMRIITADYFTTLKIPLRSGRFFDARDDDAGNEVVIINQEAARRYWPDQNPIGQQLHLGVRLTRGVRSGQKTIVGVVGDVKYGGLDGSTPPEVYLPHAQHPVDGLTIAVRTTGDPLSFLVQARVALASMDRELPMADIRTMTDIIGRSIAERRFVMLLLVAFASVAVLLAAIGVYGVLAYVVSQRTQEIGVRLAIGAAPADVVRLFVGEGAVLTAVGLACGLVGALAAHRAMTSLLFGVTATDPSTFAAVAGALAFVALGASYVPARRAARVDPMAALRTE
jgi:putative ABC transport system permease protein